MPNSIDNKIVEMQFDNANFEKNVKQSIKTLEQLNKALELEDASKGFEQMEKAANDIDFSKITRAAEMIEKRFSAAGIAGAAFIERMTNGAINAVVNLGHKVVNLAKTGGIARALKLEHANFMLNGIIKDAGKVADIMNGPVNNAVSGTAYGLDSAANAAAQFVAAGLTDLKKLETALTGISGVAAMSGSSYDEIARIFTKVASRGRVMGDTIQELSTRGIAAQEELAKYLHKTTAEVEEMRKKGQISFEIFANAMNDAFGEQAKKANDTFEGAMSNVKAALSRIGAKIATPALENIRKVLVSLIDVVNNVNKMLSAGIIPKIVNLIKHIGYILPLTLKSKRFNDMLAKSLETLNRAFTDICMIAQLVRKAFKAVFPGDIIDKITKLDGGFNSLLDLLELSDEQAAYLQMTLEGLFTTVDIFFTIIKQIFDLLLPGFSGIYKETDSLSTKLLKITATISVVLRHVDDWIKRNNILKAGIGLVTQGLAKLTDQSSIFYKIVSGIGTVVGGIVYVFSTIAAAAWQFLQQVYKLPIVQTIIGDIRSAVVALGTIAEPILLACAAAFVSLLDSMEEFANAGYMTKGLEKFNDILNNVYWGADSAFKAVGGFFNLFKKGDSAIEKIDKVVVPLQKMQSSYEGIADSSGAVTHTLTKNLEETNNAIIETAESSKKGLLELDKAGHIFAIGFGASIISAGVNIGRAFNNLAGVLRNIKSTTTSIKFFFEQLNLNLRIKTLLSLAAAIAVFAGSLWVLCQVPPGRLFLSAAALTAVAYAISFAAKALASSDIRDIHKFSASTKGLLNFALALGVLAVSVKMIAGIGHDWESLALGLAGLAGVITMMTLAMLALGKWQKNAVQGTTSLLAFAGSIYIIMSSLQKIQLLDLDKVKQAIPILLEIIGGLALVSLAMSVSISPFGGIVFVGVVAGIIMLCEELSRLGGIDPKALRQVLKIIDELGLVLKSLIVAMSFIKLLDVIKVLMDMALLKARGIVGSIKSIFLVLQQGVKYLGVAAMIVSVGAAIYLIGNTMIKLSAAFEGNTSAIIAAGAIVSVIFIVLTRMCIMLIESMTNVLAVNKNIRWLGVSLLGIAAAILAMTGAIAILGNLDHGILIEGLIRTGELLIVLAGFLAGLSIIQKKIGPSLIASVKTFSGIAILIGILVASIAVLGILAASDVNTYLLALGGVVAILSMIAVVLGQASNMHTMTIKGIAAIIAIAGVFAAITYCITVLDTLDNGGLAYVALRLALIDGAVAMMGVILKKLGELKPNEALVGIAALGTISACMLALSATLLIISNIENSADDLFSKLAVMELAVAGLAGLAWTFGEIKADKAAIGLAGLAVITACMAVLGITASIIASVKPENLLQNMLVIMGAVTLLSVAVAVLGSMSAIAIPGAAVLLALGAAMIEFAAAAVMFGSAVDLIAVGMQMLGTALEIIVKIDLLKIAKGLLAIGGSMFALAGGALVLGLVSSAFLGFIVVAGLGVLPISMLGDAMTKLSEGVAQFNTLNLENMLTTMKELGDVIDYVNGKALAFLGFSAIASAVGNALLFLGAGVNYVSVGILALSGAINVILAGLSMFTAAVTLVAEAIDRILKSVDNIVNDLTSLGENTINDIYSALIRAASDALPRAGQIMSDYVINGFKDGWAEGSQGLAEDIAGNLCDGLVNAITSRNDEIYDCGYDLLDSFIEGVNDRGEMHSPSVVMTDAGHNMVDGYTNGIYSKHNDVYKAGTDTVDETVDGVVTETVTRKPDVVMSANDVSDTYGGTVYNGVSSWLSNTAAVIKDFFSDPLGFIGSGMAEVNKEVEAKMSSYMSSYNRNKTYGKSLEFDVGVKNGTIIYIPGVGYVNRETAEIKNLIQETSDASVKGLSDETEALGENSGATGKNSKAKSANEKANDKKTKAIDEETDALGEETEATEDNEEAIRAMAEEIFVVTKAYDKLLDTQTYKDTFKLVKRQKGLLGQFWSSLKKDGFDSVGKVETAFSTLNQSLLTTTKAVKKGVYAFNDADKYMKKYKSGTLKSEKDINRVVLETGKTIAKVYADRAKIYSKTGNGVEKMTIRLTKNVKSLAKYATEAKNFVKQLGNVNIQGDIFGESMSKVEDFIRPLREIERFFVNFGTMPNNVKKYLQDIRNELMTFHDSMRILNKSISGTASLLASKNEGLPYVEDAFISLAASMYDGSEAANEYATEHARLLFLMEHGLATIEEVEEHYKSYISRITEALTEYYNTLQETLSGSLDIWTEFDRKMDDQNKDLLSIIDSQLGGYQQWSTMLMELSKRGIEFDLLKELTDSGVSSFGKLKNLLTMTNEEFAYFNLRYIESQQAAKSAADMALAALANARTMASARAASVSGKMSRAQLEESKKAAKYIADNNAAVARYQARYNNMTKRQEKEYLKSLDARQKKEYKAAKKAEEKRLKELKAAAATETAKRAEDERVKALIEGIKTFAEYNELLKTHIDDVGLINEINKQLNETLKDMGDITKNITVQTGTADEALLKFADTLEDTGEDGLSYFEEMAKRIEKFRDGIADTIKSVDMLSDSFANVEKQSIENIMDTLYSNYSGITSSSALFSQISNKGFNAYVMEVVVSTWKSDMAKGNELIEELLKATNEQVGQINAAYEQNYKNANDIANQITGNAASSSKKTIESLEKEVASKQKVLEQRQAAVAQLEEAVRSARAQEQAAREAEEKRQTEIANGKDRIAYLKNLAKQNKISAKQEKELISLLQKYGGTYNGVKYAMIEAADAGSALINSEKNREMIERMLAEAVKAEEEATRNLADATNELADADAKLIADVDKLKKKSDAYVWFKKYIKSVEDAKKALQEFSKSSYEVERVLISVNSIMNEFGKEKELFNTSGLFETIKKYAEHSTPFDILTDGVLLFGESITEANEDANAFWSDMLNNLTEYQKQLKSSIQSSSDFFSKFDGSTKKTATNYMSYAQSQIDALKTWRENLLKLADMGLSGEILEKFASQGLSSFEQVNAWANATQEQIGAYNQQWKDYQEQVEKASEAAMTSIVATWSEAGKALSDELIKAFGNYDKDLLEDAGYEASQMIITGVKNGLTNAMPEIVGIASESTTSEVAKQIGKTVGNAINQGLVSAIASSVETTVNAAVEKFKMAVDNINLYIQENLDTDYTITIHVNTDELDAAVARMNAAISGTNVSAMQTSNAVTASQANNATPVTTTSAPASNNTTVNYTQNNYSPKSLSRQEIYRQTQNQLSTIQGVVSAASP